MSSKNDVAQGQKRIIERSYRARPEELWDLWTTKEGFESWWGPVGFRVEVHALQARLGGTLHYDMIADDPEQIESLRKLGRPASHATHATFTTLQPFERLGLTHQIDFFPGVEPYASTILVEFFAEGPIVRMKVTLDPTHDEQFSQMQAEGFTSQLTKLDERFAS